MGYSRLNKNKEYTLDEIIKELESPTPVAIGDYITIVDVDDGVYYVLKIAAKGLRPIYPVYYKIVKVGKWETAVQSLIMFDRDV